MSDDIVSFNKLFVYLPLGSWLHETVRYRDYRARERLQSRLRMYHCSVTFRILYFLCFNGVIGLIGGLLSSPCNGLLVPMFDLL